MKRTSTRPALRYGAAGKNNFNFSLDSLFRDLRALPGESREVPVDHVLVREATKGPAVGLAKLDVAGAVDGSLDEIRVRGSHSHSYIVKHWLKSKILFVICLVTNNLA